jgi:uncharacterized protein (TIGR00369 family)
MSPLLVMSLEQLQEFFVDSVPHKRALKIRVVECRVGYLSFELPYAENLIGNPSTGEIHEGAITTLIDSVCGSVILTQTEELRRPATLDLRIDFLRKGRSGFNTRCDAECLRLDHDVAFVRAVAHEGNVADSLAIATGTFALFTGKSVKNSSHSAIKIV